MFTEMSSISDPKQLADRVQEYNTCITELWDKLMGLELQLVDQLEVVHAYLISFIVYVIPAPIPDLQILSVEEAKESPEALHFESLDQAL